MSCLYLKKEVMMIIRIHDFVFMVLVPIILVLISISLIVLEYIGVAIVFCLFVVMNLRLSNTVNNNSMVNK